MSGGRPRVFTWPFLFISQERLNALILFTSGLWSPGGAMRKIITLIRAHGLLSRVHGLLSRAHGLLNRAHGLIIRAHGLLSRAHGLAGSIIILRIGTAGAP